MTLIKNQILDSVTSYWVVRIDGGPREVKLLLTTELCWVALDGASLPTTLHAIIYVLKVRGVHRHSKLFWKIFGLISNP